MSSTEPPSSAETSRPNSQSPNAVDRAPSVAVLSVVCHPGPWFDSSLKAIGQSSYPNLMAFVLEVGSSSRRSGSDALGVGRGGAGQSPAKRAASDTATRVREAMPKAYFRTLRRHPGYAEAVNAAVDALGSPDYLIFADDDVAPEPSAIAQLVKRAEETSANIVSPKYVDWNEPTMVRSIGGRFDATGKYVPIIDNPELDQGQHDSRKAVMAAEGGFILIRTEFFNAMKRFDKEMTACGEMLDFSWRAAVAGSQVEVVSTARVRYLGAHTTPSRNVNDALFSGEFEEERVADEAHIHWQRNRARRVLKVHTGFQFIVVLALQLLLNCGHALWGAVTGNRAAVSAAIATVTWNAAHWRSLIKAKIDVERSRKVKGNVLRHSYTSVRRRWSEDFQFAWEQRSEGLSDRNLGRDLSRAGRVLRRLPVLVGLGIFVLWLIGSRQLLSGPVTAIGLFMPLDEPVNSLRRFFLVWPASPMGEDVPASPAHLLLGVVELLCFGATVFAQKLLILGAVPFGVWSMSRLARPMRASGARFIAAAAYALTPVPYEAISAGRFDVLVAYALAPMVIHRLLRLDGSDPYLYSGGVVHVGLRRRREDHMISPLEEGEVVEAATPKRRASDQRDELSYVILRRLLPLGALIAVVGAFSPQVLAAVVVVVLCLAASRFPIGSMAARRLLAVSLGAIALALLMLSPAIMGNEGGWSQFWKAASDAQLPSSRDVIGLSLGQTRFGWLTAGIFVAGLVALLIGKSWRFQLAARLWFTTLVLMAVTWAGANDYLGGFQPQIGVWFAFIAVFAGLSAATSIASLVYDRMKLPPWWRALGIRIFVTTCVVASLLPLAYRASDGRWGLPASSVASTTSWMRPGASAPLSQTFGGDPNGSFRAVWLGPADVIPGSARDFAGLSGAVTYNGPIGRSVAPAQEGGAGQDGIAKALQATLVGESVDLGARLRSFGVRYIAIPTEVAQSVAHPVLNNPDRLTERINQQLDMRQVASDPNVRVWENIEWSPIVPVALNGDDHSRWRGRLEAGTYEVLMASSPAWQLRVDGTRIPRGANLFANTFEARNGGEASLDFVAPRWFAIGQVITATLWILVIGIAIAYLPRRKRFA